MKAADLGSANASFYIGEMLRRGLGVEYNPGRASEWMLSAAQNDYAPAQYVLGKMYAEGEGLAVNREEAINWMTKAVESGDEDAKKWLEEHVNQLPA